MVSHTCLLCFEEGTQGVLILIVMDNGLSLSVALAKAKAAKVLILIVMDNGLSPYTEGRQAGNKVSLNPYCNG